MRDYYIYTAGGMCNLSHKEQTTWRWDIEKRITEGSEMFGYVVNPVFFNPLTYYNFEEKSHKSEREIMEFDLDKIRRSDLVVVNFNDPKSIGTAMEIAVARENRIPIIGLNEGGKELHHWLIESCTRICDTMQELCEHIEGFYLM